MQLQKTSLCSYLGSAARACISSVVLPVLTHSPARNAASLEPLRLTNRKESACMQKFLFGRGYASAASNATQRFSLPCSIYAAVKH